MSKDQVRPFPLLKAPAKGVGIAILHAVRLPIQGLGHRLQERAFPSLPESCFAFTISACEFF